MVASKQFQKVFLPSKVLQIANGLPMGGEYKMSNVSYTISYNK